MSKVKQVIVIRKDLRNKNGQKVRTGKLIAQASHASMKVILDMMKIETTKNVEKRTLNVKLDSYLYEWLNGKFTKVCLSCENEEELLELYSQSKILGLPTSLIIDTGLTEFDGVPTKTCIAIGPYKSEDIDKITGKLKLL